MKNYSLPFVFIITLFFCCRSANAQLIDNTSTNRKIDQRSFFRFHYDNDFFTKTDEYYSQGITFEYVHPSIKRFPLAKLLWKPYESTPQYGLTFNVFGYTPTSIKSDAVLYGDRPFDANMTLKTFAVQTDEAHHQQVSTAFTIGVMGPLALGYDIQYNIHKWLDNPLPRGWQNQIQNDIILNYQLNYEKQIVFGKYFSLNAITEGRIGTLNNKVSGGFNFIAGRHNNKFKAVDDNRKKAEYYFFGAMNGNIIGYDATMQGGLFNRKNPYIIASKDINRFTMQADAGIIVNFNKLYLSYTQSFITKEFRTGNTHRWGGFSIGFAL